MTKAVLKGISAARSAVNFDTQVLATRRPADPYDRRANWRAGYLPPALGWLMHQCRLARDYEADPTGSMITIAMIDNLARRLTDETTPTWRYD
jgi:hypothetical protein